MDKIAVLWDLKYDFSMDSLENGKKKLFSETGLVLAIIFCHFLLVNFISNFAMTYYPNTGDEFAILFQAKIFSLFKLVAQAPPVAEVFNSHYLEINQGKWFSQYPPVYSLLITPGVWLGYPLFIVSLLSSLTLYSLCSLLKKLLPENSRVVIILFLVLFGFSPTFLLHSSSYYNHIGALLVYSVILHHYFGFLKERRLQNLIWISLLFGLGIGIRPYTFFLLSLPLACGLIMNGIFKEGFKKLLALILPFLCMLGVLVLYNYNQSGEWFSFSYLKAGENASKLSLGHFNLASFQRIFQMLNETFKWLLGFGYFSSGILNWKFSTDINVGFLFFLPVVGFLISKMKNNHFYAISLASIFCLVTGHIFYDFQGGRFGERFFFEITWMLVLFLILFMHEILSAKSRSPYWILILLVPAFFIYIPKTIVAYKDSNIQRMDLFLKTKILENAVIHVGSVPSFDPSFYVRNHPELEGTIYVALNPRKIWEVMEKFSGKEHYVYSYDLEKKTSKLMLLEK